MTSVVLAGGGTAGHTSPLIATAEALRRQDEDIALHCIGTARGLETRVIPAAGLDLSLIDPVPMPRRVSVELAKVPLRLRRSVQQAVDILSAQHADVLVGFGGYVSMPAYFAARKLGIPVVIHEQNSVPGLANKVAARFARRVITSFPGTRLPHAEFIGMPLRRALTELAAAGRTANQAEARRHFGLDPERPTVLVSGGSQGARSINNASMAARDRLLAEGVQILHVWGPKNFTDERVSHVDPASRARYQPVAYVERMEQAYAAADLMVGRSGAGTVVETAALGLPGVFVPLPHGNGEQARNAESVVAAGAAVLVPDAELDGHRLADEVLGRVLDPRIIERMSAAGRELMPADAADQIAAIIIRTAIDRGVGGGTR